MGGEEIKWEDEEFRQGISYQPHAMSKLTNLEFLN